MGCCNKRHILSNELSNRMKGFYFRDISLEFIETKISEFSKSSKNYNEFWVLTKLLGVHCDLNFQVRFWESSYFQFSEPSLDGLLLMFIFLGKGEVTHKLHLVKHYLGINLNFSKEEDASKELIMNLAEFKKILFVYFSLLTTTLLSSHRPGSIDSAFSEENVREYVDLIVKGHVKKNFYINAGSFLASKIDLLTDENKIRKELYSLKHESRVKQREKKSMLEYADREENENDYLKSSANKTNIQYFEVTNFSKFVKEN